MYSPVETPFMYNQTVARECEALPMYVFLIFQYYVYVCMYVT